MHKYNTIEIDKNVSSLLNVGKSYENMLPGPPFKSVLSSASMDHPYAQKSSFFPFSHRDDFHGDNLKKKRDTRSERQILLKCSVKQWPCPGKYGPRICVNIPAFPRLD